MKSKTVILGLIALVTLAVMGCGVDPYDFKQEQAMDVETMILHQQVETITLHEAQEKGADRTLMASEEETHESVWEEDSDFVANDALDLWREGSEGEPLFQIGNSHTVAVKNSHDAVEQALVLWAARMNALIDETAEAQVSLPVGGPDPVDSD